MSRKITAKEAYAQGVKDYTMGIAFSSPPSHYPPLQTELWEQGWVDKELGQDVVD